MAGSTNIDGADIYDVLGQRIASWTINNNGPAQITQYTYDAGNPLVEMNASGQVTRVKLYGPAVDQVLASESTIPSEEGQGEGSGTVNWMLSDNQGTVRDVVQQVFADGAWQTQVADHLSYTAFGSVAWQSSPSAQPRFDYTGKWTDPTTGLQLNARRWYDAVDQVFISRDPDDLSAGDTNLSRY